MSLELDRQLRAFCEFMDQTQGPITIDDILDRTGEVPMIPGRRKVIGGRTIDRRWITAAAAMIAVVIVGLTLRFVPVLQRDVPPASETQPTTTSSPPPEAAVAAGGSLDTPLGTFNWWKLTGVDTEFPNPGWPVRSRSGYSLIDGPWGTGLEYWSSTDGKVWLPAPSPGFQGNSAWLEVIAGDYWLTTDGPAIWRSEDGETWAEVPLPVGYSQTPYGSLTEVNGGVWLTGANPLGVWRLDGTSWTSLDPGSIAPGDITELNGWTGVSGGPVAVGGTMVVPWDFDSLGVFDSNELGFVVTPPWGPLRDRAPDGMPPSLTVLASEGQFLAYVSHHVPGTRCAPTRPGAPGDPCVPEPQPVIEMWTSADGLTWTGPTRPGFLPEGGGAYGTFRTEGDLIIGEVHDPFGGAGQVWISEDGINWSDTGISGHSFSFIRLDSGAIYFGDYPYIEMFFSTDLRNWERVDVSALSVMDSLNMTVSAGDTAFFMVADDATGRNAMWVLELQE